MGEDVPIILLSGMAADERLFEAQVAAFPNLRVQSWVPPWPGESLQAYAARIAPMVDPGRPCIVGGASFGGVVALELATHIPTLACILIGSVRSPAGLPWRWRLLRPVAALGPDALRVLAVCGARLGWLLSPSTTRRLARLSRPGAGFVRWAMCAVVRWRLSPATRRVRVFHIHGEADRVLPARLGRPDVVVPGGSHALSLFSPAAVNEFVAGVVRVVAEPGAAPDRDKIRTG
ncbi:MAG TPA: alpha/beta hydrolase [Gemmata sp.]